MAPPLPAPPKPVDPLSLKPVEYWNDPSLALKKGSIDNKYAKAKKKTANVPHNYVSDLQKDLIELGYLKAGADDSVLEGRGLEGLEPGPPLDEVADEEGEADGDTAERCPDHDASLASCC